MINNVFEISAYAGSNGLDSEEIHYVGAGMMVVSLEVAELVAAGFPKFVKVKASRLTGNEEGFTGYVSFMAEFTPTKVTSAKNETGMKRLRAFLKVAPKLVYVQNSGNAVSKERFDAFCAENAR